MRIFYTGAMTGSATVPETETLFELCFTVIGPLGSQSLLEIDNMSTAEYSRGGDDGLPLMWSDGLVSVTDQDFPVGAVPEDETCTGTMDGSITATASGAEAPYTFAIRRTSDPVEADFRDARTVDDDPAGTTFDNLTAGRYNIRVRAADGSESIVTAQVDWSWTWP